MTQPHAKLVRFRNLFRCPFPRLFFSMLLLSVFILSVLQACTQNPSFARPIQLAQTLPESPLKAQLLACQNQTLKRSELSISHRGAPLGYPEHTEEGYRAAAAMGASVIECDVTFTKDLELVCRHSQCDLHTTTNILRTALAQHCSAPFVPADGNTPASAQCCTSDLTLAQFKQLCGRRDISNRDAKSVEEYLAETPYKVEVEPIECGTLLTHAQSIALFAELGTDFTPELKRPEVPMPFGPLGFTQTEYATLMLNEYVVAGVDPRRVHPQSFNLNDIKYWIQHHPDFANQVVYLDPRGRDPEFQPTLANMQALKAAGVQVLAPPMPMLLTLTTEGELAPSDYAKYAKQAGLELITWTLEAGEATDPGNWLYANLKGYMSHESKMLEVLHALKTKVGIRGIFSDWPATVTYYDNCMNG